MKIVHLITGLGMGGAERQLAALVEDKSFFQNMENIVISLKDEGVIGKLLISKEIRVYSLNLHKSLTGLWHLWKILKREKPDVLQTWLYHADLLGLIFGKMTRVPRIIWNIRCSNMNMSKYSRFTAWIFKLLAKMSSLPDGVITNSRAGQKFHLDKGYKPKQRTHIANGIDTKSFCIQPEAGQKFRYSIGIPQDALVMGMIGRADPMKDYPTFLKVASALCKEFHNLYCIVAGEGTVEAVWQETPPRLHRLGVYNNMPELINGLDIFVLSSAFGEGFPNVVGEAMACGIPVIATDVGDTAFIVENPEQIVPPCNVEKLLDATRFILNLQISERKTIGLAGRERVVNSFSLIAMRKKYENFYKEILCVE